VTALAEMRGFVSRVELQQVSENVDGRCRLGRTS